MSLLNRVICGDSCMATITVADTSGKTLIIIWYDHNKVFRYQVFVFWQKYSITTQNHVDVFNFVSFYYEIQSIKI